MTVVTIGQRKGGNGKSTATLNLAAAFAEAGKRVVIVDLDDQKNTTSAIAARGVPQRSEERPDQTQVGDYGVQRGATVEELLVDESVSLREAAVPTDWPGVSLVAASGNLSGTIRQLDAEVGGHQVLAEKLTATNGEFDLCLLDTSPALNILVVNALVASDYLFIPLSSRVFSLQGLGQTLAAFAKVQNRLNPELGLAGAAFVIHDRRSNLACEVVAKARAEYPELILGSEIGQNIAIEEAQSQRQSILSYAPANRGAAQYRALAAELGARMGMPVPTGAR